jgi:2-polyprenyl-3-methyl-5-hydroxy-6-metoxy-1,4-benzoquinol methylase
MTREQSALSAQQALLENVAASYRRDSRQDDLMRIHCVRAAEPWMGPADKGLEIGCSDGLMTQMLAERLARLHVVEATESFADAVRNRNLGNVVLHRLMIEEYLPDEEFDCIFATWVLTHLVDAQNVLTRARDWLRRSGVLFVVVPNARVLSRQLALEMGILPDLYELTANDRNHGHIRAYDRQRLNRELETAGLEVVAQGGLMLKPLADYQMDDLYARGVLGNAHVEGLFQLGHEYPDLASAIFAVCRKRP